MNEEDIKSLTHDSTYRSDKVRDRNEELYTKDDDPHIGGFKFMEYAPPHLRPQLRGLAALLELLAPQNSFKDTENSAIPIRALSLLSDTASAAPGALFSKGVANPLINAIKGGARKVVLPAAAGGALDTFRQSETGSGALDNFR